MQPVRFAPYTPPTVQQTSVHTLAFPATEFLSGGEECMLTEYAKTHPSQVDASCAELVSAHRSHPTTHAQVEDADFPRT